MEMILKIFVNQPNHREIVQGANGLRKNKLIYVSQEFKLIFHHRTYGKGCKVIIGRANHSHGRVIVSYLGVLRFANLLYMVHVA